MEIYNLLEEKIKEADLILVGVGSAFQYDWDLISADPAYSEIVDAVGESNEYDQFLSFLQYYLLKNKQDGDLLNCYNRLADKLAAKNYFFVTTTIDDVIYDSAIDSACVVTPCGGFRHLQCVNGCENQLFNVDTAYDEKVFEESYIKKILPKNYQTTKCPVCNNELTFNQIACGKYVESDYLDKWQQYRTWLMGTMHRKVVILELGAGLEFATIIRSPFEKMVTYNENASLFRIHPNMSQIFMDDSVKNRAFGINMDVKEFILGWN